MAQQFVNNARSVLVTAVSDSANTMAVSPVDADMFPVANVGAMALPSNNDWFKATLTNLVNVLSPPAEVFTEIVAVRTRSAGNNIFSDVIRGYETDGSGTARAWPVGTVIRIALTAADIRDSILGVAREWNTIPGQAETAGRTLTRADVGKFVPSSGTVTIPAGVFLRDDVVVIYNDSGADISIAKDVGVTLWWVDGANANRTLARRGVVSLLCVRGDEFVISGQGLS
ncbi:MAG: hypothetical protein Q7U48_13910 [Hydrogenophaga sp.]|nr:hypothetical protein [Hydrogenophaga sp.]